MEETEIFFHVVCELCPFSLKMAGVFEVCVAQRCVACASKEPFVCSRSDTQKPACLCVDCVRACVLLRRHKDVMVLSLPVLSVTRYCSDTGGWNQGIRCRQINRLHESRGRFGGLGVTSWQQREVWLLPQVQSQFNPGRCGITHFATSGGEARTEDTHALQGASHYR